MKNIDTHSAHRLRRLSASALAISLLAAVLLTGAGSAAAQTEERIDTGRISMGRTLFRGWCRTCHGDSGKGDGPMAEHLRVAPADLTLLRQNNGGHFYFGRVIEKIDGRGDVRGHGSKDMPVWGEAFQVLDESGGEAAAQEKILALAHYLRSIQETAKKE